MSLQRSPELEAKFRETAERLRFTGPIAAEMGITPMAVKALSHRYSVSIGYCAGRIHVPLVDRISALIERDTGVTAVGLQSAYRGQKVARARQVAMHLLREVGRRSYPEVGRAFGNRDHTTAMHGIARVHMRCLADPDYGAWVTGLTLELKSGISTAGCEFVDNDSSTLVPDAPHTESQHTD